MYLLEIFFISFVSQSFHKKCTTYSYIQKFRMFFLKFSKRGRTKYRKGDAIIGRVVASFIPW